MFLDVKGYLLRCNVGTYSFLSGMLLVTFKVADDSRARINSVENTVLVVFNESESDHKCYR